MGQRVGGIVELVDVKRSRRLPRDFFGQVLVILRMALATSLRVITTSAPRAFRCRTFSWLILSGMTRISRYPFCAATSANPRPVLPAVASTSTEPGPIFPSRSAVSIIERPMRSLIEPPGFWLSNFRNRRHGPVCRVRTSTSGVLPIKCITLGYVATSHLPAENVGWERSIASIPAQPLSFRAVHLHNNSILNNDHDLANNRAALTNGLDCLTIQWGLVSLHRHGSCFHCCRGHG